ncbi:hypothetical protein D1638_09990 [Muribaculaceae bacterium Z1]|nr:hypothetical protein [Muribaculaceae bacterium Z1]
MFHSRAGLSLFLFARNFFLFLFSAEQVMARQPKEKNLQKKFFNVGVVGAKRTIFRLLLHRKILI